MGCLKFKNKLQIATSFVCMYACTQRSLIDQLQRLSVKITKVKKEVTKTLCKHTVIS